MKLNGKVALVTGASRGIGAAIASKLASLGCDVAINYAGNIQKAEETLNSVKAYGVNAQIYQANVANYEEVEAMTKQIIKDFGHLDIIINNAGISEFSPITETSVEDFDKNFVHQSATCIYHLTHISFASQIPSRKSPVWQNYQYLFHPLFNERTGKRKLCGFQRRNLFTDPCTCFIPCRLSYHRKLYFAGMDSDQ